MLWLRSVGWFHPLAAAVIFVVLPTLTACVRQSVSAHSAASLLPPATAVGCTDAPQLRQRAIDDRRRSAQLKSDQEKTDSANRANFFASLATIASLKCKVTAVEADEALIQALDAAQKAAEERSFYKRTNRWNEANFIATEAIALLVQRIPGQPLK